MRSRCVQLVWCAGIVAFPVLCTTTPSAEAELDKQLDANALRFCGLDLPKNSFPRAGSAAETHLYR